MRQWRAVLGSKDAVRTGRGVRAKLTCYHHCAWVKVARSVDLGCAETSFAACHQMSPAYWLRSR